MIERLVEILHVELPWKIFLAPAALLWIWLCVRWYRSTLDQAALENQGGKCRHGRPVWKSCKACAEEFAAEAAPAPAGGDPFPRTSQLPAPVLPDPEDSSLPDPPAPFYSFSSDGDTGMYRVINGRKLPLRIDIDKTWRGVSLDLEITTNAAWPGCATELTIVRNLGGDCGESVLGYLCNIPPGAQCYHQNLTVQFGHDIKAILIPDYHGIERIRLKAHGQMIVDATPAALLANQDAKR